MSIGARLKEERLRLGLSQTDFAGLAGSSKGAQLKWEKDDASPNALALNEFAKAGADVNYILTGVRSEQRPSNASRVLRSAALSIAKAGGLSVSTDDEIDAAFAAGKHPSEIEEFAADAKELNIPMSALTRGKAMGIIDSYGVRSGDMIQLLQSLALDITMDIIDRRSKD